MTRSIIPSLAYEDAPNAVNWLHGAFGLAATTVVPGPDNTIAHAELKSEAGGVVMVLSTQLSTRRNRSPKTLGGTAESVYMVVSDIEMAYDKAVAAGAEVFNPLHDTDYGSREFCCLDPEGHIWTLGTYQP